LDWLVCRNIPITELVCICLAKEDNSNQAGYGFMLAGYAEVVVQFLVYPHA